MAQAVTVLQRLLTSLTAQDPTWDVSVGSPVYKIFEAFANELAIAINTNTLTSYSFDVNSKSGVALDAFVNIFGINRRLGTRAVGAVSFSISSAATQVITIPIGTQIYVPGSQSVTGNNIYFSTVATAFIGIGQTEVQIPIQAVLPGSFSNVQTQTITAVTTALIGSPSVINYVPTQGGTDTETDTQLQIRFLQTAFANISGTVDKYVQMALQDPNVTQVNVVGAQQAYTEQDQVWTIISGNSTFIPALSFQAQLTAASGSNTADLTNGSFPLNVTVSGSQIVSSPIGWTGAISNNGSNYVLNTIVSGNTVFTVNYLYNSLTLFSGSSTISGVAAFAISGLSILGVTTTATYSGTTVSGVGKITFNQPTGFNLIVSSGTVSGWNSITSQIPDSKYTYPEGGESIGQNLGSVNQVLLTNGQDYNYPTSSGVPLVVTLNPNLLNAPLTYTGELLQMQSEYIPISSRIANPAVNSNFVDVFINGNNATSTTSQVLISPSIVFTSGITNGLYNSNNFSYANGVNCISGNLYVEPNMGDYYIGFANRPAINWPAQLVSGNQPSFISFISISGFSGVTNIPICTEYVNEHPPSITGISGTVGTNMLTTNSNLSALYPGLVMSGTGIATATTLSGIPFNTYIVSLSPGAPNTIYLSNTLTSNVITCTGTFVTVGYPVYDITNNAGSVLDMTGIAVDSTEQVGYQSQSYFPWAASGIVTAVGTVMHNYNYDVSQVNDIIQQSRVVGANVLVRQAQYLNLIVNLSVIYVQNANIPIVNSAIQNALVQFLQSVSYDQVISFSNLAAVVYSVGGVASARVSTIGDNPNQYGILSVPLDGSLTNAAQYTSDILLANNQLAQLFSMNITTFGLNNF
jgi:uncharacterized phage protein gp47/JayE